MSIKIKKIMITGGAGFIGSALIRHIINNTFHTVLNIDKLTYAGNLESLNSVKKNDRYFFKEADICDVEKIKEIFENFKPDIVIHLAAESHVDRSIDDPSEFIKTNIFGTYVLLQQARIYFETLKGLKKTQFRFHHVSTDEVYGDLDNQDSLFTEETAYSPSSPYSASKASAAHLVRSWYRTFKLPILITNCSNNYGPYQFPEKLIPLVINNALEGKYLPVYGDGKQVRDWLYVDDHARALLHVALNGEIGDTYNIGGHNEMQNIQVIEYICDILDSKVPSKIDGITSYRQLIKFVEDRSGHDIRYAIDASKIADKLAWTPIESFETGINKTVQWYLKNSAWSSRVKDGSYKGQRLGVIK